jgi:hypothetical protein
MSILYIHRISPSLFPNWNSDQQWIDLYENYTVVHQDAILLKVQAIQPVIAYESTVVVKM